MYEINEIRCTARAELLQNGIPTLQGPSPCTLQLIGSRN